MARRPARRGPWLVPREPWIDFLAPTVDAARKVASAVESLGSKPRHGMGAADAMMAIHDEFLALPAFEVLDAAGKVAQRDEEGAGEGHEGVLVGLAHVEQSHGLSGG